MNIKQPKRIFKVIEVKIIFIRIINENKTLEMAKGFKWDLNAVNSFGDPAIQEFE